MGPITSRLTGCWILAVSLTAVFAMATQPATESDVPMEKMSRKLHGRLPAYYRLVVSEEQRMEIYRIQAEYQEKLNSLQNELKRLKQDRSARIVDVLTEEQKKRVEKAVAEAKAKRAAKKKKKATAVAETDTALPPPVTSPENEP